MGLSLKDLSNRIRDVFDANTESDKAKRVAAGQPLMYADQQRQMGNNRPNQNFGQAILGNTARVANTIYRYNTDILPRAQAALAIKAGNRLNLINDRDYINAANYLYNGSIRNDWDRGGIFNAGTVIDSQDELNNLSFKDVARKSVGYGAGTYGEIGPVKAPGGILGRTTIGATEAAIGDAGSQYVNTGKVNLGQLGISTLFGASLPNVSAGASKVLGKAGKVINNGKASSVIGDAVDAADNVAPKSKKIPVRFVPDQDVLDARFEAAAKKVDSAYEAEMKVAMKKPALTRDALVRDIQAKYEVKYNDIVSQYAEGRLPKIVDVKDAPAGKTKMKISSTEPNAKTKYTTGIDSTDPMGNRGIISRIRNEIGGLVDDDSQMIRLLRRIEKETGRKGLVDQFYFDSGNVRASNSIANSTLLESGGFKQAVGGLSKKEIKELDRYASARAELKNYDGKTTSRSADVNKSIVSKLDKKFSGRYKAMNEHYKMLAERLFKAGIISEKKYLSYTQADDYIRIQRDMSDLVSPQTASKSQSRSFSSTSTRFKRTGSKREIMSPTKTMMERTQQLELEVQRNIAANNIIDALEEVGLARIVKEPRNQNTISRFKNGKKETFEVHGDIKKIVDGMGPNQMGVLAQVISAPVRAMKAGATGLNIPFAVINYIRDQGSSAILSKNAVATHMPSNILTSLGSAIKDFAHESNHPLWKEFNKYMGDQTIFSELQNPRKTNQVLREARMGSAGVAINRAISPIRTVEDLISITEKATRFQNFKGIYKKVLRETGDHQTAIREAVLAGRQNSVDFARSSQFTRTMSLFIPYFNAGVQGSRSLARSLKERPIQTVAKTVAAVGMPTIAVTAYNMSDPERRAAYESINEYEKKDNYIIITPNAKQRSDGTWEGIVKIPKPQGFRDLADPMRVATEQYMGSKDPVEVEGMMLDVLSAFTGSIEIDSPQRFIGSVTPQQVKPAVQFGMGRDLYSGRDTIPAYMDNATDANGNPVPESDKAYKSTSGSMRILGKLTGQSPLKVEKLITDTTGSVGRYAINATDKGLVKQGKITDDQVGGRSIKEDFSRRLMEATGETLPANKTEAQKYYETIESSTKGLTQNEQAAWKALHPSKKNFLGDQIYEYNSAYNPAAKLDIYNRYPKVFEADKKIDAEYRAQGKPGNPLFDLTSAQVKKVLEKDNLPAGAKDPELSNLYKEEWYQDYQVKRSAFYSQLRADSEAKGQPFGGTDNPYPEAKPELQQIMDYYNGLPKGTGQRSAFIRSYPDAWNAMQKHFADIDAWQNKQREKRGLAATEGAEGEANGYSTSSSSYSSYRRGSGGSRSGGSNPYRYAINTSPRGGKIKSARLSTNAVKLSVNKGSTKKPKVSIKKSKV